MNPSPKSSETPSRAPGTRAALAPLFERPIEVEVAPWAADPLCATDASAEPDECVDGRARRVVRCVVPCFNRRADLELLLEDLASIELDGPTHPHGSAPETGAHPWRVALDVVVVDNASAEPLSTCAVPPGLVVQFVRSEVNTGGSGGFNLGLLHVLRARRERGVEPGQKRGGGVEFIWMLDSDARLERGALVALVEAFDADPARVGVGSALKDPKTGKIYEIGGKVLHRRGGFGPVHKGDEDSAPMPREALRSDYVAACSFMVRPGAVEAAGLLPDVFIKADDVEWGVRLARTTGGTIVAEPRSIAIHPCFDRFETWIRYYYARNLFVPIAAVGRGPLTRMAACVREIARGAAQAAMGRMDLARMHVAGLRDAARGVTNGKGPEHVVRFEPFKPLSSLRATLEDELGRDLLACTPIWIHPELRADARLYDTIRGELSGIALSQTGRSARVGRVGPGARDVRGLLRAARAMCAELAGAMARLLVGSSRRIAIVPTRGRPTSWCRGDVQVNLAPEGFVVRRTARVRERAGLLADVVRVVAGSIGPTARLVAGPLRMEPWACAIERTARAETLSIVLLSHNRREELLRTIDAIASNPMARGAELIVVDNASKDGSAAAVRARAPHARVVALRENIGVGGFNRGVAEASGDVVLVLDDDAIPDIASGGCAIERAMEVLRARPDVWAVALHPKHPSNAKSEWSFAPEEGAPTDDWPVMGCANLVRRWAWSLAGGYEQDFFLYRNDTDLALKIRRLGGRVYFDPALVVWHNSPIAARKSDRWLRAATRNWIWVAKRHGHGLDTITGSLVGWLWAHRLAGLHPARHARVLAGAWDGFVRRAPPLPLTVQAAPVSRERGVHSLLKRRFEARRGPDGGATAAGA